MTMLSRLIPDRFILLLLATIALASVMPARGDWAGLVSDVANAAIFMLFFFHGLRLPRETVIAGLAHWRLQLAVLAFSYAALPLVALFFSRAVPQMLTPELWTGVLFLGVLPSTVQAAIASSSMAKGNVAASVIASAASNLFAVFATPLLFALIAGLGSGESDMTAVGRIMSLLLLPFILGQMARRWLGGWAERKKALIGKLDRTTIILTVYSAFSAAVIDGLWSRLDTAELTRLALLMLVMLIVALAGAWALGAALGFRREDRITLLFAGAHKSLATGAPMARILFPAAQAGMIVIPLMIYHQLQLMISAWIASALAKRGAAEHQHAQHPAE
ncbi:MAG: bile acid:sodium symporter [Sphingomonadales bacterium]|nr:bile acid:sodium symporter [Sphingomonadales bacterium]